MAIHFFNFQPEFFSRFQISIQKFSRPIIFEQKKDRLIRIFKRAQPNVFDRLGPADLVVLRRYRVCGVPFFPSDVIGRNISGSMSAPSVPGTGSQPVANRPFFAYTSIWFIVIPGTFCTLFPGRSFPVRQPLHSLPPAPHTFSCQTSRIS